MKKIKQYFNQVIKGKTALKLYRIVFQMIGLFPKKNNLVIFESFHGKQFSDNPRAIYEYMEKNYTEVNLIWSVDRRHTQLFENLELPYIKRFTFKWFWYMPRAKYWVNNVRTPNWLPKPKNTILLQTWHGTPLKKLGADIEEVQIPGTNTEKYIKNVFSNANQWDYLISPNRYSTTIFERAFDYTGHIIESGYPRNDILINHSLNYADQIKKDLNIDLEKKVILYAPTWRDDEYYSVGNYKFDIKLNLKQLQDHFGDRYIILLRMHYLISDVLDLSGFEEFVIDVSSYTDIRDLYIISDVLITDYSSVFFDYANLKRPIIFYAYDIEKYRETLRGFYFNLEEAPGPITKTTEEVIHQIKKFEQSKVLGEKFESFYQKFCYLEDGGSTQRVVSRFYE
ncbi:CDP-glycerol glycerophosphotransferase family protein [Alkalibacillus sp. S2W]|uniref:CDP-glycerol glycerophosphotransferase family protein n=1 Tax=Alkalibacillus sp. S2W TaxID=3386553 RepID=UPI00398D4C44